MNHAICLLLETYIAPQHPAKSHHRPHVHPLPSLLPAVVQSDGNSAFRSESSLEILKLGSSNASIQNMKIVQNAFN